MWIGIFLFIWVVWVLCFCGVFFFGFFLYQLSEIIHYLVGIVMLGFGGFQSLSPVTKITASYFNRPDPYLYVGLLQNVWDSVQAVAD